MSGTAGLIKDAVSSAQVQNKGLQSQNSCKKGKAELPFDSVIQASAISAVAASQTQAETTRSRPAEGEDGRVVKETQRQPEVRKNIGGGTDRFQTTEGMKKADQRTSGTPAKTQFDGKLEQAKEGAGELLTEEIANELGISQEEVRDTLTKLGLGATDLYSPEHLVEFFSQISGEDASAILTDGNLFQSFQNLMARAQNCIQELSETLGIPVEVISEEWKGQESVEEKESLQEGDLLPEFLHETRKQMEEGFLFGVDQKEESTADNGQAGKVQEKAASDPMTLSKTLQDHQTDASDQKQDFSFHKNSKPLQQVRGENQTEQPLSAQAVVMRHILSEVSRSIEGLPKASPEGGTQAQELVRQIMDYLRVQTGSDMTSMEMQLHPQSLGKLHISIQAMGNGDMIAQFTAQNESVKTALQTQLPQLLERFEEQGLKVSEVQVGVDPEAYGNGQNRSGNGDGQEKEQEKKIARVSRLRRMSIDLTKLEKEDVERLNEEDRIEAQMMRENGNTVNFRA